jgi:hypothetical protein
MKTFRLTVKRLFPSPEALPSWHARPRYVYRIRRDREVIQSGITDSVDHAEKMLARKTAA